MKRNDFKTKVLMMLLGMLVLTQGNALAEKRHELFTNILTNYVDQGKIDFTNLCQDKRLNEYTDILSETNPEDITAEKDRFAFWLNVYNAYSLQAVCKEYPIDNINDLNFGGLVVSILFRKSVWDRPLVIVNNETYTLRQVDHEILRPSFQDARIQFAIACGAIGCAPSRSDAYEGDLIDHQLDDQTKKFINDPRLNSFDNSRKRAELSPLFNWSKKDFGKNDQELLLYIANYLPKAVSESIFNNTDSWKIKYKKYDLTLNDDKD